MAEEPSVGGGAFEGAGTTKAGSSVSASVGLRLDKAIARQWMGTYDELTSKVKALRQEIKQLNTEANQTTRAVQGRLRGGGVTNASTTTAGATSNAIAANASLVSGGGGGAASAMGMMGGGGGGGGIASMAMMSGNPYIMAAGAALKIVGGVKDQISAAIAKLDARVERGYDRALTADRLGVLYQQTGGINQQQYYNRYRVPLQQYRLGVGGINTLLGLQATTGINAQRMAPGVEAIRTISGYSLGTADVASMLQTLASPEVNNRMTMTMGTGLYGPGGRQRDPMAVIQQIVRASGLTNERVLAGAQQPGSMTRARLTAMGVPPDMQDIVIQYAMENMQFQKRTGGRQGMYNPSDRGQMKIMGIDKNFATEREVTDRKRELREESFYNKQRGAYAQNERNLQAMTDLTRAIEENTSALIGGRIRTKNNPIFKAFGNLFGSIGQATNAITGDPAVDSGGHPSRIGAPSRAGFSSSGLHSTFADRLNKLMSERPGISIGQGVRSSSQQRTLFMSRYVKTNEKTGVYWNGSFWRKSSPSFPDAAPPGLSMHELGLAADLRFATKEDEQWLQQNAARYGLKTFGDVINEPWHVQPAELPNSRRDYERAGAPWGRPAGAERFDETTQFGGLVDGVSYSSSGRAILHNSQISIAESISLAREGTLTALGGGAFGRAVTLRGPSRGRATGKFGEIPSAAEIPAGFKFRTTPAYEGWGFYIPKSFSDADLEMLHLNEQKDWTRVVTNKDGTLMGGFAMNQYNWNRGGGQKFAKSPNLATPEQQKIVAKYLLDTLNIHDGFESIVRGRISWPGVGKLPSIDLPTNVGRDTIYSSKGDPMLPVRGGSSTIVVEGSGGGITIAPNIYIQSSGSTTADAQRAAEEVANIVTRRAKSAALRGI